MAKQSLPQETISISGWFLQGWSNLWLCVDKTSARKQSLTQNILFYLSQNEGKRLVKQYTKYRFGISQQMMFPTKIATCKNQGLSKFELCEKKNSLSIVIHFMSRILSVAFIRVQKISVQQIFRCKKHTKLRRLYATFSVIIKISSGDNINDSI